MTVMLIIGAWIFSIAAIHFPKFDLGKKSKLVFSGLSTYSAIVGSLLVSGERPVWLVAVAMLFLIPVGAAGSYVVQRMSGANQGP